MRVLVTGGTGVIGEGLIPELLRRGHSVRLLSRHAGEDAKQWDGVDAVEGDVSDARSLRGSADGCDAVVHVAGIVAEEPPDKTFESVNVSGTRNMLNEAEASKVRRFVYVSSLGADTGTSDYHRSKLAAERLVESSALAWTIVRPGAVYGPGDEVISMILKMVRALPAVPVLDGGDQEFQPLWYEDFARLLVTTVERDDLAAQTFDAAGRETTTTNDLLRRFGNITDRQPARIPVPHALALLATKAAAGLTSLPIDENKLKMLREGNVVRSGNAFDIIGLEPTPLDEGLRMLADALPEVLPEDGTGSLEHKRFWADITGSRLSPSALMARFRDHVNDFMPLEFAAEPGVPEKLEKGATLTASIPGRGNIQVRVEISEPTHIALGTIEGHPLAGAVEFFTSESDGRVRFLIEIHARAANLLDWFALRTVGSSAQAANWRAVVQRVLDASGGTSDGVHQESEKLKGDEAEHAERRIRGMVQDRKRDEMTEELER